MKKRLIAKVLVLILTLALAPIPADEAWAQETYTYEAGDGSIYEYSISGSSANILGYTPGLTTDIVIPSSFSNGGKTYEVYSIKSGAFNGKTMLTGVEIPDSVVEIDMYAFEGCENLANISLGDGLRTIWGWAFKGCSSLKSITIPAGCQQVMDGAFQECESLESIEVEPGNTSLTSTDGVLFENSVLYYVTDDDSSYYMEEKEGTEHCGLICYPAGKKDSVYTLPSDVNVIEDQAFYNCCNLTRVSMGNEVEYIGEDAFCFCSNLESVSLSSGLTYIERGAFCDCEKLESIEVPSGVSKIPNDFCYRDTSLKRVSLPYSITKIGSQAFGYCESLESIELPAALTETGSSVFISCYALTEIELPSALQTISSGLFSTCINLKIIFIPAGVTAIEYCAFGDCENLENVLYGGSEQEWDALQSAIEEENVPLLEAAIHFDTDGLIAKDKVDLQLLYDQFSAYSKKEMTNSSWVALQEALADAGEVLSNDMASNKAVRNATVALEKAHDSLVPKFWSFKNRPTYTTDLMAEDRIVLADLDPVTYASKVAKKIQGITDGTYAIGQSCYGMSLSYAQAKRGILDPGSIETGCDVLGQISKDSAKAKSYIARCQMYQFTQQFIKLNARYLSQYPTDSRKLDHLLTEADGYYDQHPVLFGIGGPGNGGHAMTFYGYETGSWDVTNPDNQDTYTYNCRFKVYDSNYPTARVVWEDDMQAPVSLATGYPEADVLAEAADFAYDRYLYYNIDGGFWAYPAEGRYHMDSDGEDINIFIPDIAELTNRISPSDKSLFITGQENIAYSLYQGGEKIGELTVQTKSDLYQYLPTFDGDNESSDLLGTYIINQERIVEGEPVTIKTEDGADFSDYFQISYGGFIIAGYAQGATELTVYPDGRASLSGVNGQCDLTISKDGEKVADGVRVLTISSDNLSSESLSFETADKGLLVSGDNLNALTVTGFNVSETDIKEATLDVDGDYSSVMLSGTDGEKPLLTALADDDGDQIYDKTIASAYLESTVTSESTDPENTETSESYGDLCAFLNTTTFAYNGKARKPAPVVYDDETRDHLVKGKDYKITYASGCKNVGTYFLTVIGLGSYAGQSKKLSYTINPKGTSLGKLTAKKKSITVKWKKQTAKMASSRITGYAIQIATNSKFTKGKKTYTVKGYSKHAKTISKLKAGKKYYVRIRTYKTVNGKKYFSAWSKVKSVKTKK